MLILCVPIDQVYIEYDASQIHLYYLVALIRQFRSLFLGWNLIEYYRNPSMPASKNRSKWHVIQVNGRVAVKPWSARLCFLFAGTCAIDKPVEASMASHDCRVLCPNTMASLEQT